MADDIRDTDQTKLDIDVQLSAKIKYEPISDKKKMNEIKRMTVSDPTMQILKNYMTRGWPETIKNCKNELKPYFNHRTELVLFHYIILKGEHDVIPAQLRIDILEKIHEGHQGQEKCKRRANVSVFFLSGYTKTLNW